MVWVGFIASILFGGYLIIQGTSLVAMMLFMDILSDMKRNVAEWVVVGFGVALIIAGVIVCYYAFKFAPFTISVSV